MRRHRRDRRIGREAPSEEQRGEGDRRRHQDPGREDGGDEAAPPQASPLRLLVGHVQAEQQRHHRGVDAADHGHERAGHNPEAVGRGFLRQSGQLGHDQLQRRVRDDSMKRARLACAGGGVGQHHIERGGRGEGGDEREHAVEADPGGGRGRLVANRGGRRAQGDVAPAP